MPSDRLYCSAVRRGVGGFRTAGNGSETDTPSAREPAVPRRRCGSASATAPKGMSRSNPVNHCAAILGALALSCAWAAKASATNYECSVRDVFTLKNGMPSRGDDANVLQSALSPLRVDTQFGIVQLGLRSAKWTVRQPGNASSDFIAEGGTPADILWLREWTSPASFLLVYNSMTVVTGTCEAR